MEKQDIARLADRSFPQGPPGAKASDDSASLIPGINPRLTAGMTFSASCEAVPLQSVALSVACKGPCSLLTIGLAM